MIVSLIAAMAENRVIGRDRTLPWDLPEDRRLFRQLTWGHPVIMGRKTFQSIGGPLPGRINIVLSRQEGFRAEGCQVAHRLDEALHLAAGSDEVFVCGGEGIFREALRHAQRIYLTLVHVRQEGDTFFPGIPPAFVEKERRPIRDKLPCELVVYERQESEFMSENSEESQS